MMATYPRDCTRCGANILPSEEMRETGCGRLTYHVRCAPPTDWNSECEACEAERRGWTHDITSQATGAYCDEHAGEHEEVLDGKYCIACDEVHKEEI